MVGFSLLYSHTDILSFRNPAADGAAILHWPWRTRDESCWQYHGNGFPGPTQFTSRRHNLPTASFLLQHTSTSLWTGGEGQVARCYPEGKEAGQALLCVLPILTDTCWQSGPRATALWYLQSKPALFQVFCGGHLNFILCLLCRFCFWCSLCSLRECGSSPRRLTFLRWLG